MKKNLFITSICLLASFYLTAQDLDMELDQVQFSSANGGKNRIQSFGGTFPGIWLFKSRFDDIHIDSGENSSNRFKIFFKTGGIERARINNDGYFGIGTTQPNSLLTIGYNGGANQLAFERLSGDETFSMNINSSNQILFKNSTGGGDYDFQSNIGGQGLVSSLFIDGTEGNVGIGTSTPETKLDVNGRGITLNRDSNYGQFINLKRNNSLKWQFHAGVTSNRDELSIRNSEQSSLLTIEQSGNIGIGTTNPQLKLEVAGSNNALGVSQTSYSWNSSVLIGSEHAAWDNSRTNATGTYFYRWTGTSNNHHTAYIGQEQNNYSWGLAFKTDNKTSKTHATTTRMFIDTSGDIGIGTTTPLSRFHVEDTNVAGDVGITIKNKDASVGTRSVIDFITTSTNTVYGTLGVENIGLGAGAMTFSTRGGNTNEKMRILSNGNVGIGATNIDSKLTVAGNIHAREVKVTIDAGADFVFNKDYKLPPLEDVSRFIKENKHLPEIASEKEMQKNGLYLAEMNIKLLQKIEELTLYAIEQEKSLGNKDLKIKNLEEKLKLQETRIRKIEVLLASKN